MSSTTTPASRVADIGGDETKQYMKSMSLTERAMRRILRDRLTMLAIVVLATLSILTILGPVITGIMQIDPNDADGLNGMQPFGSPGHLLGTDNLGRDQFARLLHAGRVSLGIGFFGAVITLTVGMALGIITGFFGGVVDDILNWVITTLDSIPSLYLLIMISAILAPTAEVLIFVIALTSWTGVTRIIRGQTLQIRNLDYVLSARALGSSVWRSCSFTLRQI